MRYIGRNVSIRENVFISNNVVLLGHVLIEPGVIIEDECIIGKPSDTQLEHLRNSEIVPSLLEDYDKIVDTKTIIKKNCYIGSHTIIYSGATLQEGVICKDYTMIGWDTTIGRNSKLMYRAQVHSWVSIGECCRIGGFCCNDAKLGNYVSMFGNLLHAYRKYGGGKRVKAPIIGDHAIVGWGAQVLGDVSIGNNSYVASGSVVTKSVPSDTIVTLVNKQYPIKDWHGRLKTVRVNHGEEDI